MSLRVALITEIIAPYRIPVFNALARFRELNLHVIFLAETDPTQREWLVYKDEIEFSFEVLPSWRRRSQLGHVLINRGMQAALNRFVPQSIICGGYNHIALWEALAWARMHKARFSTWIESTKRDSRSNGPMREFLKRRFLEQCDSFVVPGQSSFEYVRFLGFPAQQIFTAPNAVDIQRFGRLAGQARSRAPEIRAQLGLPEKYFLFVGRLIEHKGIFQLLEAYSLLDSGTRSQFGLVYVGDGDTGHSLLQKAEGLQPGAVQVRGFLQRDQLAEFYALAYAFVFPTLSDPWGLVVNEAMACGLPVIATDVAGCTVDLVREGENGIVVPAADARKLAAAMATLASDPAQASRMAERGATLIEGFTPEKCATGLAGAAGI